MERKIINRLIVLVIFFFGAILFALIKKAYVFYSDPYYDKNLLEYSLINFRSKREEYNELGKYYTEIETKYPRFSITKDFKLGLICRPVGPFEEDSAFVVDTTIHNYGLITYTEITAPENKQLDFKLTRSDEYLMEKLGVTNISSKTDSSGNRYLYLYSKDFNKLEDNSEMLLYYLPNKKSIKELSKKFREFKTVSEVTEEKEGFFVEDSNWVFVIRKVR